MVYGFIERTPYSSRVGTSILDPKGGDLHHVPFLDPSSVDPVSRTSAGPMGRGYPVDPAGVPGAICWESTNKALPDVFMCRSVNIVSEKVRAIIERFEPGVHQLLPVAVHRPKAKEPFAHHYWLVICRRIDSVDKMHTTHKPDPTGIWDPIKGGKFVFSRAAIGDAHLWRDPGIPGSIFCSQALGEALAEAKVSGLYLSHSDEA